MKTLVLCALLMLLPQPALSADMPAVGAKAPAFTLPAQDGTNVSLADYRGKWLVLYFYPKDFSHGCTIEARNFQKDIEKYKAINTAVVGISVDEVDSHKHFCTELGLDFKLLSDADHKVSEAYGSLLNIGVTTLSARHSFLIDPQGIIRKAYGNVDPNTHSDEVLKDLSSLNK